MSTFEKLKLSHYETINEFLASKLTDDTLHSPVMLIGWYYYLSPQIHIDSDFVLIKIHSDDDAYFISPLVKDKDSFPMALDFVESIGGGKFLGTTKWQSEIFLKRGYQLSYERDFFEYIYDTQALTTLAGKKLHSKRNFINSFAHPFCFRDFHPTDFKNVFEFLYRWREYHKDEHPQAVFSPDLYNDVIIPKNQAIKDDYDLELDVIERVLKNIDGFNIFADVMEIDGRIVGFCLGQMLSSGVGAIYIEKADMSYRGIYALLDNQFIKKRLSGARVINKQEDLGIDGIRKSKLSFCPSYFVEVFVAVKL
jgi:hypothetical protein